MIKVKSFIEQPLTDIANRFGFNFENGETVVLGIESDEHEGDLYLPDFLTDEDEIEMLNAKEELGTYQEEFDKSTLKTNKVLNSVVSELGIDDTDENLQAFGSILFDKDYKEAYYVCYLFTSNKFGIKTKSFKLM